MSINSSLKSGKGANDSNNRLSEIASSNSRLRRENFLKKKRGGNSFLDNYNKSQTTKITLNEVEENKNTILNPNSNLEQLVNSVQFFRKMLSNDHSPPIDLVIGTGILPYVTQFLTYDNCRDLQYECAWVITNICSGTKEQTAFAVDCGVIPQLIRLLSVADMGVKEQVVWALGNIAGDCVRNRDAIIESNSIHTILNTLADPSCSSLYIRNAVWLLSNLCRIRDGVQTNFEAVRPCLPVMMEYLKCDEEDIVVDACWCFAFITDGNRSNAQYVQAMGVIPIIMQLLGDKNIKIVTPALRTIGNFLAGDDNQTQVCLDHNVLYYLEMLINSSNHAIVKETLWCLSNITAGNEKQIKDVLDRGVFPYLIECIYSERMDIQREACWVICNAICGGTPNQILQILNINGTVEAVCKLIRPGEDLKLINIIIETLDRCVLVGDFIANQNGGRNEIKFLLDECGALDTIEQFSSADADINKKIDDFIDKHFGFDDDVQLDQF